MPVWSPTGCRSNATPLPASLLAPQNRCVLMASYNGERCIRMWELPSFESRGTLVDVSAGSACCCSVLLHLM